jgi:hypothetical protein
MNDIYEIMDMLDQTQHIHTYNIVKKIMVNNNIQGMLMDFPIFGVNRLDVRFKRYKSWITPSIMISPPQRR